ncbi:vWA domain-containing protein [Persicirhabdus sediminis]|uniref:RNA-binding protein n=1 Tax=Persicirhabdus sediminis TaxID=454144 RepID=A0A8J7SM27_9BACT|nr:RNA-binding protein [Persicirhabdus sediminis]MBK1790818.1 RNA-binding protein [Persicirhabdus sediminis]
MANKNLFQRIKGGLMPHADTQNSAGGRAYQLSDKQALAQYVATGCLNGTFYNSDKQQLENVLKLAAKVETRFLAQLALYARTKAYMKDTPALLCAIIATRDTDLLAEIFPQVIDNGKMLRNFVQIMRSGVTGRKSLGSAPKRMVQQWLNRASDQQLIYASVGNDPSLLDVIKMVHPRPKSSEREQLFAYYLGRAYDISKLPHPLQDFENYKKTGQGEIPQVPFQLLTSLGLGKQEWQSIARTAPWHMTRMNLNTFLRHGVFDDPAIIKLVSDRLRDPQIIKKVKVFPYQLMAAYMNASDDLPAAIREALQDALEISLENVPVVEGKVAVCIDVSGSMHSPITGYRGTAGSKVKCVDVASLITAAILRKNPLAEIIPFTGDVLKVRLNPRDSVMSNAAKLASLPWGGTNCSAPLRWLNKKRRQVDTVIFVSDNESWLDSAHYGCFGGAAATETMKQWSQIKQRSPSARMACIDLTPHGNTQAKERDDILNIGGFSDQVFKLLASFSSRQTTADLWVDEIEKERVRMPLKSSA